MAVTSTIIRGPNDANQTPGQPVLATLRRERFAVHVAVTSPDGRTGPLARSSTDRLTVYIEGVAGDEFDIQVAYAPAFNNDGSLDPGATGWIALGSATIPASGVAKQTFEDVAHSYRIVRTSGTGDFDVYAWWLG